MKKVYCNTSLLFIVLIFLGCTSEKSTSVNIIQKLPEGVKTPKGMVWIPGGSFQRGAVQGDEMAMNHEKPRHAVTVDGFFMDVTEVTNEQFANFVEATGYITQAEKMVDWNELKKQVPEETAKPHDSLLQPGSMTFKKTSVAPKNPNDYSIWWNWSTGANWRHPEGPNSSIVGKENHPVVHIAYQDALAYCNWAKRRLPTEAEWEYASRGNQSSVFFWGNTESDLVKYANTWEGEFPTHNTKEDGYERTAPVKSYLANSFGLYDMAGNVWEWTTDWYNVTYYKEQAISEQTEHNPKGAENPYNPNNPLAKEKVIKGGSFLCNSSYCASYRVSARMSTTTDSSMEHLGFRTVKDLEK